MPGTPELRLPTTLPMSTITRPSNVPGESAGSVSVGGGTRLKIKGKSAGHILHHFMHSLRFAAKVQTKEFYRKTREFLEHILGAMTRHSSGFKGWFWNGSHRPSPTSPDAFPEPVQHQETWDWSFRSFRDWERFHSLPHIVVVTRETQMSKIMSLGYNCMVEMHTRNKNCF